MSRNVCCSKSIESAGIGQQYETSDALEISETEVEQTAKIKTKKLKVKVFE